MSARSSSSGSDREARPVKHSRWSRSRSPDERKHRHKSKRKRDHHEGHHHSKERDHERHRKPRDEHHHRRNLRNDSDGEQPVRIKHEREDRGNNRHHMNRHQDSGDEDPMQEQRRHRQRNDRRREQNRARQRGRNPFRDAAGEEREFGRRGQQEDDQEEPPKEKDKPDFGLSGKLAEDTNTYRGVVIKYSEPAEARKPKRRWRLYPFKGDEQLPLLHIHRQSAYLIGRNRLVADIPIDHPSCSKQHAALQYRLVSYERDDGRTGRRVNLYIIDLDSANGTYVNNQRIDSRKYVQLLEKDVVKFGFSSREYVLLHDNSQIDLENDEGTDGENDK